MKYFVTFVQVNNLNMVDFQGSFTIITNNDPWDKATERAREVSKVDEVGGQVLLTALTPLGEPTEWRQVMKDLLDYAWCNTCLHEETHRVGSIWTVCDHCGREWSDDRNPMTDRDHETPPAILAAEQLLKGDE